MIEDACAYIVCQVVNKMETDSHTVFLGKVLDADNLENAPAMTYSYYHTVVKGKSPKNAPTYLKEEETFQRQPMSAPYADMYMKGKLPLRSFPTIGSARSVNSQSLYLKNRSADGSLRRQSGSIQGARPAEGP